jgi:hypothetical protein
LVKDNRPLYGARVRPGPEPFEERVRRTKISGDAKFSIAFDRPAMQSGQEVIKVLDILGSCVHRIFVRVGREIFSHT